MPRRSTSVTAPETAPAQLSTPELTRSSPVDVPKKRQENTWIKHVKSEAERLQVKFGVALLDPQVRQSYPRKS